MWAPINAAWFHLFGAESETESHDLPMAAATKSWGQVWGIPHPIITPHDDAESYINHGPWSMPQPIRNSVMYGRYTRLSWPAPLVQPVVYAPSPVPLLGALAADPVPATDIATELAPLAAVELELSAMLDPTPVSGLVAAAVVDSSVLSSTDQAVRFPILSRRHRREILHSQERGRPIEVRNVDRNPTTCPECGAPAGEYNWYGRGGKVMFKQYQPCGCQVVQSD